MPKSSTLKAKALRRENYVDRFKSQRESVAVNQIPSLNRTRVEEQLQELKERQGRWAKSSQTLPRGYQKTSNPPSIVFRPSILTDEHIHIPTEAEKTAEKYGWKTLLDGEDSKDRILSSREVDDHSISQIQPTSETLGHSRRTNIYEVLELEDEKPKLPLFKASIL